MKCALYTVASVAFVGALFALTTLSPSVEGQTGGVEAFSIDMDSTGNTATTISTRQECREVLPGATLDIDVTATNIRPSTPMLGYSYLFEFRGPTITVTGQQMMLLRANPGSQPFNASEAPPQFDGTFDASALDIGASEEAHETGSGVLDRLTIEVNTDAAPAIYVLALRDAGMIDIENIHHPAETLHNARLAVGVSCNATTPLPPSTFTPDPSQPPGGSGPTPPGETGTEPPSSPTFVAPTETRTPGQNGDGTASPTMSPSPTGVSPRPTPTQTAGDESDGDSAAVFIVLGIVGGAAILVAAGWFAYQRYQSSRGGSRVD